MKIKTNNGKLWKKCQLPDGYLTAVKAIVPAMECSVRSMCGINQISVLLSTMTQLYKNDCLNLYSLLLRILTKMFDGQPRLYMRASSTLRACECISLECTYPSMPESHIGPWPYYVATREIKSAAETAHEHAALLRIIPFVYLLHQMLLLRSAVITTCQNHM